MDAVNDRNRRGLICLALALVTVAVFWSVTGDGFVNYDDDVYVTQNPAVNRGLTWSGLVWAFTRFHAANWHPLTWISLMLDCQLFGLNAGALHAVNLAFHAANAVLLFLLLNRLTGALWRSAMVAGLFALHPLHVESVAWIAERKDVLSAFFALLALLAYARFAEASSAQNPTAKIFYGLALFFFVCGLLSKPMVVTLPGVMLLLDFWPMRRLNRSTVQRLLLEKIPFFALALASGVVTFAAQKSGGAVASLTAAPGLRLDNALVSYVCYLGKMFWPVNLAVLYPLSPVSVWRAAGAAVLLLAVSWFCFAVAKRRPYWLMGWLWFLGMLAPVIGLIQVGQQAYADRYTYLPLIGLFVAVVWGAADGMSGWKFRHWVAGCAATAVLSLCAAVTVHQLQFWKNGLTLFRRALAVTTNNALAENDLAAALAAVGNTEAAFAHYAEAARLAPHNAVLQNNFGVALARAGRTDDAIARYQDAIRLQPDYAEAYNNLGAALAAQGRPDAAVQAYREAARLDPGNAAIHFNLGSALLKLGRVSEAVGEFSEAARRNPDSPDAQFQLGRCLAILGRPADALEHLRQAARLRPDWAEPLDTQAWILATDGDARIRNGSEAVRLAEAAATLTHGRQPVILNTLAAAYAEAGRFDDAVATAGQAIELAQQSGQTNLAAQIQSLRELYQQRRAFHHP